MPRMVQPCGSRALISGHFSLSCLDGLHVLPVGGPKKAKLFNCLARSAVVNLASSELPGVARAGDVNASLANSTPILPWYFVYTFCHARSRCCGRKTTLAGLPLGLAMVSRRTSMSLVLLQPQ